MQTIAAVTACVSGPAAWVLTAYLAVGVIMNGISRSKPERAVMAPVALVLAVCSLIVSRGPAG
ncbi:hypothetical protein [Cellulomonas chengniuliangii]|uniref:Uncharacterized protein n=1 Tax=Cellulomonas chengniuliangii TaxID=2968084 RepID=A0ABY5L177_9CELL|nr:hypothetical protein [Cellulomonas chengniuliangii]MCC2307593.1 hypothetical protein [Cellulomonas chengniuliangii]UUI75639.1 hypothetical protein NP064_01570 [Cellulomonas chengniuliangii]